MRALAALDRSFRPDRNLPSMRSRLRRCSTAIPTSTASAAGGTAIQRFHGYSLIAYPSGPNSRSKRTGHAFVSSSGEFSGFSPYRATRGFAGPEFRKDRRNGYVPCDHLLKGGCPRLLDDLRAQEPLRMCLHHQSRRAPENLTTFAHFAVSFLMNAANWAGVLLNPSMPTLDKRSFTSG